MKKIITAVMIGAFLMSPAAFANQIPKPLGTDSRMRVVAFNENDVVTVECNELTTTSLQLGDDEVIQGVEGGDSIAWLVNVNKLHPNVIFIKPIVSDADTNLTVLSNLHNYHFKLVTSKNQKAEPTYNIRFIYPETLRLEALAKMEQKRNDKNAVVTDNKIDPTELNWEYDYSCQCSQENVPVRAFDDGKFTYFQFAPNAPIPAIFLVDSQGHESLANASMKGTYVVVQKTARQFSMRNGTDNVSCIFNEAYKA